MKRGLLRNTISLFKEIGDIIASERKASRNPAEAMIGRLNGVKLFTGRVVDLDRRTVGGFARGKATFKGMDADAGKTITVDFQNEFLVASGDNGILLATTPHLICVLDADGGLPVTTEQLRYGIGVTMIGIPSPAIVQAPSTRRR